MHVFIALNTTVRVHRRHLGLVGAILLICLALVSAHGAVAGGHMTGMAVGGHVLAAHGMDDLPPDGASSDDPVAAMMTMCLAVVQTAALTFAALAALRALAARRVLSGLLLWPRAAAVHLPCAPVAPRARPPDLAVLQVFRR